MMRSVRLSADELDRLVRRLRTAGCVFAEEEAGLLAEAEGYLDLEKRRAVMAKLEKIMLDDGPAVVPVWRAVFNFSDKKIKGYQIHPSIYVDFKDLWLES